MHRLNLCGVVALAGLVFSDVSAAPYLLDDDIADLTGTGGVYTITMDPSAPPDALVRVRFTDDNETVNELRVVTLNNSNSRVRLDVQGVLNTSSGQFTLKRINSIVQTGGTGELWISNLTANDVGDIVRDPMATDYGRRIGEIVANRIVAITANWGIQAERIEATGTSWPGANNTDITTIRADVPDAGAPYPEKAINGVIMSDIITHGGNIGTIWADGFIGGFDTTVQLISTKGDDPEGVGAPAGGDIGTLRAGALGEVDVLTGFGGGDGSITAIRSDLGGWGYDFPNEADLDDPLICGFDMMGEPIFCDYDPITDERTPGGRVETKSLGLLELRGGMDTKMLITTGEQTGIWKIGDSLGPNALITLRNSGLTGQIAINANGGDGQWLGVIRVAQTANVVDGPWFVLDEPEYDFNPGLFYNATLGQVGAAGLQSYALWDNACDPRPGGIRFRGSIDRNSIEENPPCIDNFTTMRIAFYGGIERVNNQDGWDEVVLLEKRQGALNQFSEVTEDFSVSPDAETRGIKLVRGGMAGTQWETGTYRITILPNKLRVRGAEVFAGEPQLPIASIQYEFSVVKGCEELDLNGDLLITYEDMVEWMIDPVNLNNQPTVDGADASTLQRGIHEHGPEN